MNIRTKLEELAAAEGWHFVAARRDYANLYQAHQVVNDTVDGFGIDESVLILDPVKMNTESDGIRYSGSFMILTRSDLKKTYEQKYDLYIRPLTDKIAVGLPAKLECVYDVNNWQAIEVVNELDLNGDGYAVTFDLKAYF